MFKNRFKPISQTIHLKPLSFITHFYNRKKKLRIVQDSNWFLRTKRDLYTFGSSIELCILKYKLHFKK